MEEIEEIPGDYVSYFDEVKFCYRKSINALRKRDPTRAEQAIQKTRSTPEIPSTDLGNEKYLTYKELEKSLERVKLLSDDIAEMVMNITIDEIDQKELFRDKED